MRTRYWLAPLGAVVLMLGGCSDDDEPEAIPTPAPSATATAKAAAACLPFTGPPDGSAAHPYLKRAMALECREDVKRVQAALGIEADGLFDADTATAVIAKTQAYPCITANDGQVGPQTWSLIIDAEEPCEPRAGATTIAAVPAYARCSSGTADWALRTTSGTVVRRCGDSLVLVRDGETSAAAATELGSSVCADFEDGTVCVSDPAADDTVEASTSGEGGTVWSEEIADRYVK